MSATVSERRSVALTGLALLLAGLGAPGMAAAQEASYPSRPVRLIVPYAPGNVTDTLARVLSERLALRWKQPVVVENRPGQAGSLGTQAAAKAAPDGYSMLVTAMASMAVNPHVYRSVGYRPLHDFEPVTQLAIAPALIVAAPSLPVRSLSELVAYSKTQPGGLNYGTNGSGTATHLNIEAIKAATGLQAQHIPYTSAARGTTDLIGGRLQLQAIAASVLLPLVKSGQATPIAAIAPRRLPQLPGVPTVAESLPDFQPVLPWIGAFVPLGTPRAIVQQLHADLVATLNLPELAERMAALGMDAVGDTPSAFAQTLARDHDRLGALVRKLGITAE